MSLNKSSIFKDLYFLENLEDKGLQKGIKNQKCKWALTRVPDSRLFNAHLEAQRIQKT